MASSPRSRASLVAVTGLLALATCQDEGLPPCNAPHGDCPVASTETFVDPLVHVGRAAGPTFIEIVDVVTHGDLVLACTGTKGLTIWDASGDGAPRLLSEKIGPTHQGLANGSFPRCQHVSVDPTGTRVVITNRGDEIQPTPWLWVYDISDPRSPDDIGGWTDLSSIEGVVYNDGLVYAALHGTGVLVYRVTEAGGVDIQGGYKDEFSDAWQPALAGNHLYVAEGATGLRIYDVESGDPELLSTLPLPGSSRDVIVEGDRAYVADSAGMAIVDISDPRDPQLLSQIDSDGTSLALAMGADDTVVMAEWDQVRGYDVSDPTAVETVFAETVPTDDEFSRVLAIDADRDRRRVYAGEWRGLQVFDHVSGGHGPDISITPNVLQYGLLTGGESDSRVVVVRNRGDVPLTVHDVVGGPGVTVDTECFQVPPGGATAIEVTLQVNDHDQVDTGLKFCSDDPDESEHVVSLSANVPGLGVGDEVPAFALQDLDGNTWSTEQLRGNIAVLAYFATF
ncbi:MAG: hypothetical protein AAF799_41650 [Myxococcota bacterium]